ncbi:MAG: ABC transporter permease [Candidatus Aminicenantes bacterium]|nr:MAG: ABC transporter permease [Candidatus Aminicenantes bacterium]
MFKNYIKTALRNLFKHKGYSLINILGLSIGMAACLLILLFVYDELSYDSYNENADRIFRVAGSFRYGGRDFDIATVPAPMAGVLIDEYPEIEDAVRFRQSGSLIVQYGDNIFKETRVSYADPSLFDVFTIPLLKGNQETVLSSPNTLILSRNTAEKYFRDEDPIGKTLKIDDRDDYRVTGVFEEIPDNSHFHLDIILSMSSLPDSKNTFWLNMNFLTYILLQKGTDPKALEPKLENIIIKYMGPQIEKFMGRSMEKLAADGDMRGEYYLQSIKDIHLHSDLLGEMEPNSDIKYVYIFSAIALFILIIASINFMNLSTARSAGRAKEVGIRKVLGSYRKQLVGQFLTESMILSFISMAIAVLLVRFAVPLFNNLSGKSLEISDLASGSMPLVLILIPILTGFLAGCYPSFFISAFQPANVLKGQMRTGVKTGPLRSGLVIFQFTASIILIIGTFVVYNQLHFIQNKKLGFNKEQVLILNNTYLLGNQVESFKNAMLSYPRIIGATVSGYLPIPSNRNVSSVFPGGKTSSEKSTSIQNWIVDHDYIKTLDMKILEGRDFSRDFSTDTSAAIINQAAAQQFDWEEPLNKKLGRVTTTQGGISIHTVIGGVEDFHYESLRNTIGPLVMFLGDSNNMISFRIETEDISETIGLFSKKWKEFLPNQPFEYMFMDERFNDMYSTEQRIGKIFGVFAALAVFVGCLGLFGLAAFTAEQRTKEIGIRKILGASAPGIIRLLLKEFIILVSIANIIAWPIAFFAMSRWLRDFAYKISLSVWIFFLAGLVTLFIALLTVSYQAIRAALSDPVKSLRYE